MGKIITIGSGTGQYQYELPPVPREEDIWYFDAPKSEQYIKTNASPTFKWLDKNGMLKNVKQMTERDRLDYISYFRNIWLNGLWFMNNGEPTYITGLHFEHLFVNKFNVGYLKYLDGQRLRFYFRDLTNKDPLCDGRVWAKPRRSGSTFEVRSEAIRCVLSGYGFNVGMQSTKDEVCSRTLMKPIIDAYFSRPMWLREKVDTPNGRKPKKLLELVESNFKDSDDVPESLGGYIRGFSTTATAFDSDAWMLLIIDEFSKHETQNPRESFDIGKKACSNPDRQGKLDILSTTGDSKDAVKATMEWHRMLAESNPLNRDSNGKTVSGLYKYFIDATESFFVAEELKKQGKVNVDKYGFVNRAMTEEWIWNEHKKHQVGTKDYIFSLYKLPLKEEHVLLSSSTSNIFPKPRINDALQKLEALLPHQKPYVRGMLEEDPNTGKVEFVSDAERVLRDGDNIERGIWLLAVHPYFSIERKIDVRNRFKKINGIYFPYVNLEGAIGYDPINFSRIQTTSGNISDAAIVVLNKFNYYCPKDDPNFFEDGIMALCVYNPDDPREANKEAMKAAKYWGYPVMHEKSINHVYEDFEKNAMIPFLMKSDKDKYGISPSDSTARKDGITMLKTRFSAPKNSEQKDQIATYPFEEGLREKLNFDPDNTTPFNITMAELYAEHGLKQIDYTNLTDESVAGMNQIINSIIPKRTAV